LRSELTKTPIENLVVLCASDEGQRSWASPEWRHSVFLHYVREGLKGGASNEGRLTAGALYRYVAKEVESWARENRGERQTPVLLPEQGGPERADRIVLGRVLGNYQESPATSASTAAGKDVEKAWQAWHALHSPSPLPMPYTYAPILWREYTATLMRADELDR